MKKIIVLSGLTLLIWYKKTRIQEILNTTKMHVENALDSVRVG